MKQKHLVSPNSSKNTNVLTSEISFSNKGVWPTIVKNSAKSKKHLWRSPCSIKIGFFFRILWSFQKWQNFWATTSALLCYWEEIDISRMQTCVFVIYLNYIFTTSSRSSLFWENWIFENLKMSSSKINLTTER